MYYKVQALLLIILLLFITVNLSAQDLDPRAYIRVPVDMTVLVAGFGYTYGGVVLDPTSPIQDLEAKVETPVLGVGRTFSLFGLTSQAFVALPYSWAQASGKVFGEDSSTTRSGFGDTRLRISTLLFGAPAITREEFAKSAPQTVFGASLTVIAPTGQYFNNKLINLGTNRWSFKPELGLSYMISNQWFIDLYAGAWFFTTNNSFYPGASVRSQEPLFSFQTHVSYNINPLMWAAIDFTYYTGGQTSVNDFYKNDNLNNSRLGATFNFPISRSSAIKIAYSTGAIIRFGGNFSTISLAWQMVFF
jgi:Putative MetA-pathway of phenol degradation